MRFFKYLVLTFLSIISVNAFAATVYSTGQNSGIPVGTGSSAAAACQAFVDNYNAYFKAQKSPQAAQYTSSTETVCSYKWGLNGVNFNQTSNNSIRKEIKCPAKGWPLPYYYPTGTAVPIRDCKDGCTVEGGGLVVGVNDKYDMTPMQYTGDSVDCTKRLANDPPKKCDTTDPYGECFKPPNDNCTRLKDGSITCPDDQVPPPNNTCNGADYCKRPPEGCGSGYVPGSFNGEQLCVRSGPNTPKNPPDPDKPEDPNNCMNGGTYCPQPPDNTKCPSGYSETTFNGSKICVKDNPDPEKPNPNDPNNPDYGGGGDNGSGGSEPTDGGDGNGSTGGDSKGIIDAIISLKTALLNAISGISGKIDLLINGQKQTNQKLDTSNEHLDKIEDATQAASDAVGESNKKLDGIKDSIDALNKCRNESYNPNDKNSPKYRECTEKDAPQGDTKLDIGSISVPEPLENYIVWSSQCPPDAQIPINLMGQSSTLVLSWSPLCELLSRIRWAIIACAYIAAAYIILGMK